MSVKHNISVRIKLPAASRRPCRLLLGADDRTHPVKKKEKKFLNNQETTQEERMNIVNIQCVCL